MQVGERGGRSTQSSTQGWAVRVARAIRGKARWAWALTCTVRSRALSTPRLVCVMAVTPRKAEPSMNHSGQCVRRRRPSPSGSERGSRGGGNEGRCWVCGAQHALWGTARFMGHSMLCGARHASQYSLHFITESTASPACNALHAARCSACSAAGASLTPDGHIVLFVLRHMRLVPQPWAQAEWQVGALGAAAHRQGRAQQGQQGSQ